jgi:hypothetical protein
MPSERRPSSIVPQVLVTIGSGHDDLWSNPYPPKRELLTTQARLGRPGHRVTADPKPIREAGK